LGFSLNSRGCLPPDSWAKKKPWQSPTSIILLEGWEEARMTCLVVGAYGRAEKLTRRATTNLHDWWKNKGTRTKKNKI
jgi:hypothetical protein